MSRKEELCKTFLLVELTLWAIDVLFFKGSINSFIANNRFVAEELCFINGVNVGVGVGWFGKDE